MKDDRTCTMRHFLLHDNALPHCVAQTQDLITSFKWEQTDYPPYTPDLAQSDFIRAALQSYVGRNGNMGGFL